MTLEQQVYQQEVLISRLHDRIIRLEHIIEKLEVNSHPPIDFIERIAEAVNEKELVLASISYGSGAVTINTAKVHPRGK